MEIRRARYVFFAGGSGFTVRIGNGSSLVLLLAMVFCSTSMAIALLDIAEAQSSSPPGSHVSGASPPLSGSFRNRRRGREKVTAQCTGLAGQHEWSPVEGVGGLSSGVDHPKLGSL